jgi:lipopolysaccharide transport system ATP-binding protein
MAFQEKSRQKINEIMDREHVTVLLVTHSMESAAAFCSRGLVMSKSRLVYDGPIESAITAYKKSLK